MRAIILLAALLPLAACSTPEERAKLEAEKENTACLEAGYQAGTEAFDDCRLQIRAQEDQRAAARVSAIDEAPPYRSNQVGTAVSIPLP